MFIAFEGPDKTGKSTSANKLDMSGKATYNVTKELHAQVVRDLPGDPDTVICYDRIDWFTHMVYRLSMPDREWNDPRVRTVFAMPDTHLVFKIHHPDLAPLIDDELYERGKLSLVNPMYYYFADFLIALNRARDYQLFKTISAIEVSNDPRDGSFSQKMVIFDSPTNGHTRDMLVSRLVDSDESLLEFLREEDRKIG